MDVVNVLAQHLIPLVALLLSGVASVLGAWLGRLLARKLHVQLSQEQHALMIELVDGAIMRAEQWALNATKQGALPSGAEKLDVALKFLEGLARQYKLPEMARDRLVDLVESALGERHSTLPPPPVPA